VEYVRQAPVQEVIEYIQPQYAQARAPVEYVRQAPVQEVIEYVQPQYTQARAPVEYVRQAPVQEVIEYIQPQYAQARTTNTVDSRNLLAMGNIVSERVITVDELAAAGRFYETEPQYETFAAAPSVEYVVQQPMVEYVTGGVNYGSALAYGEPVTYIG
jgi:hypothetical protein